MPVNCSAPWHGESWDRFIQVGLPRLLEDRLPLAGYQVEATDTYTCTIHIALGGEKGDVDVAYEGIPQPDAQGLFRFDDRMHVVVPTAAHVDLDTAEIRCVGEQLCEFISERLGEAPEGLPWDASLVRSWLPLDGWVRAFHSGVSSQALRTTNWLDLHTHLRRVYIVKASESITPGQLGRTCPVCLPEGPNILYVREIAQGAEIRDGRLVIVDDRPEAGLGLAASMVPFLEHSDANRLLMGVNMMRQWLGHADPELPMLAEGEFREYHEGFSGDAPVPEAALVQTGYEPETPYFWAGNNLLTAFLSWDGDAFEDGIVISESCAKRLVFPHLVEPGDKFSNRHGTKGVVSCILPDDEMPHLPDGTPVELVYSMSGMPSRMNFGQVREAVMGRIAKAEGTPAVVPPFGAPVDGEIRERLAKAGLPEDGMETLTVGGKPLERRSTVGWVYWGRPTHYAVDKIYASVDTTRGHLQGEAEYLALREAGAFETLREHFNTCAVRRADAGTLAGRVAEGPVDQAGPPAPGFADVARRLAAAGIRAELDGERLRLRLGDPEGETLALARPVSHPWLHLLSLRAVGIFEGLREYEGLAAVNARVARMVKSQAPEHLMRQAVAQLEERTRAFCDALLKPAHLQFEERVLFSGRTVIAPGPDLRTDQVGLADEIAWTLFGPLVARELGDKREVEKRSKRAAQKLDEVMARSWVIFYRSPALLYGARTFVAFHPVRRNDRTIRLHPLVCRMTNADFDGDQAAVYLPVTEAGQREAAERLSLVGHLKRDPGLIQFLHPTMDAVLGLAHLSRSETGWKEIETLAGVEVKKGRCDIVTRQTLTDALARVLAQGGPEAALGASERLMRRGFEVARGMGASMGPFLGTTLNIPAGPAGDDPDQWRAYAEEVEGWLSAYDDFEDADFGSVNLLWKSGARANVHQLRQYVGGTGVVEDVAGRLVPIPHGWREGMTPEEFAARVAGARRGLAQTCTEIDELEQELRERSAPPGFGVLARARRSQRPGVVFARAAERGETDPLTDVYGRLFVGLPVGKDE